MTEWQPIETAPKDGTPILATALTRGSGGYWPTGWWIYVVRWHTFKGHSGMWIEADGEEYQAFEPTHWMPPLPPPPQ